GWSCGALRPCRALWALRSGGAGFTLWPLRPGRSWRSLGALRSWGSLRPGFTLRSLRPRRARRTWRTWLTWYREDRDDERSFGVQPAAIGDAEVEAGVRGVASRADAGRDLTCRIDAD